jgi:hypothetical protein
LGILRVAARAPDSYGLLLTLIVIDYILLSVNWEGGLQLVVSTVFIGLTGLVGFHTSGVRGTMLRVLRIAVALSVLASIVAAVTGTGRGHGVVLVVVGLVTLATPIAVMARLVKHERVTVQTLLGAVCVYVLIGLMFAYLDLSIHLLSGRFFTQTGQHSESDFVYFSFITLTTVGYGDLTPTTGLPRTMAVTEALVGQVFLVVLVARLVAMYVPGTLAERRRTLDAARIASSDSGTSDADRDPNASTLDDRGDSAGDSDGNPSA